MLLHEQKDKGLGHGAGSWQRSRSVTNYALACPGMFFEELMALVGLLLAVSLTQSRSPLRCVLTAAELGLEVLLLLFCWMASRIPLQSVIESALLDRPELGRLVPPFLFIFSIPSYFLPPNFFVAQPMASSAQVSRMSFTQTGTPVSTWLVPVTLLRG